MNTPLNFAAPAPATTAFVAGRLGERVAAALRDKIYADGLVVGTRLPSEQAMAEHFQVSRSILREAIAVLKAEGMLDTRKGSGAYVLSLTGNRIDAATEHSIVSLLNLIEVRGGLEAETAALAAQRRTPAQLLEIDRALRRIEAAVSSGGDGVEEDFSFHLAIAQATGNGYWPGLIEMMARQIRSAVRVTRANEALRLDFTAQVQSEHEQIVAAIGAGDPARARAAATLHMHNAAERVRLADRAFWRGDGGALAREIDPHTPPSR